MPGVSRAKIARAKISEAEAEPFDCAQGKLMARRVGGGTRRATFEIQSEFFRKELYYCHV